MTQQGKEPQWRYTVNVGPTKGLIVEEDGTTVLELANNLRSSKFESTIKEIVKRHNTHATLVEGNRRLRAIANKFANDYVPNAVDLAQYREAFRAVLRESTMEGE